MDGRQQERIESLKAGLIGAGAIALGALLILLLSALWPPPYLFVDFQFHSNLSTLAGGLELLLVGFLFGVTYRYTVRQDLQNVQLQAGTVMAFALVRGLGQIDTGFRLGAPLPELIGLLGENLLSFAIAAIFLTVALRQGWLKSCTQPPD